MISLQLNIAASQKEMKQLAKLLENDGAIKATDLIPFLKGKKMKRKHSFTNSISDEETTEIKTIDAELYISKLIK